MIPGFLRILCVFLSKYFRGIPGLRGILDTLCLSAVCDDAAISVSLALLRGVRSVGCLSRCFAVVRVRYTQSLSR